MHSERAEAPAKVVALQAETLRIIDHAIDIMRQAQRQGPVLLASTDDENSRLLDQTSVERYIRSLLGQRDKVLRLSFEIPVMGTMSAGKSTVIRAIVGSDILPSRPEPMTSYPTRIRHAPARSVPILDLRCGGAFRALASNAKSLLSRMNEEQIAERFSDAFERQLIDRILSGALDTIPDTCEGAIAITELLTDINDLCRLCRPGVVGLNLPIPAELDGDDRPLIPTIEVGFFHIGPLLDRNGGSFSLLDSPGPNDGVLGEQLSEMVTDLLFEGSAMILVSDYTARGNRADKEMRQLTSGALERLRDRLFVLCNKFDQKDARDADVLALREHLSRTLFETGAFDPERIHPIAARSAFRATSARRSLQTQGKLPDPASESWAEDFLRDAFGTRWMKRQLADDEIKEAIDALWDESRLQYPLDQVITHAIENAALLSLRGAADTVAALSAKTGSFFKRRFTFGRTRLESLQREISRLEGELQTLRSAEGSAINAIASRMKSYEHASHQITDEAHKKISATLDEYFSTGKPPPKHKTLKHRLLNFVSDAPDDPSGSDFKSDQTTLVESGANAAERAEKRLQRIKQSVDLIFSAVVEHTDEQLEQSTTRINEDIKAILQEHMGTFTAEVKERFKQVFALDISIDTPQLEFDKALKRQLEGLRVAKTTDVRREWRNKKGARNAMARGLGSLFNKHWGQEQVTIQVDRAKIDLLRLRDAAMKSLGALQNSLQQQTRDYARNKLEPAVQSYFGKVRAILAQLQNDAKDSLTLQVRSKEENNALNKELRSLLEQVEILTADAEGLRAGLAA